MAQLRELSLPVTDKMIRKHSSIGMFEMRQNDGVMEFCLNDMVEFYKKMAQEREKAKQKINVFIENASQYLTE